MEAALRGKLVQLIRRHADLTAQSALPLRPAICSPPSGQRGEMNHKGKGAVTLSTSLPALPDKGTHTQVPKTVVKDGTMGLMPLMPPNLNRFYSLVIYNTVFRDYIFT